MGYCDPFEHLFVDSSGCMLFSLVVTNLSTPYMLYGSNNEKGIPASQVVDIDMLAKTYTEECSVTRYITLLCAESWILSLY